MQYSLYQRSSEQGAVKLFRTPFVLKVLSLDLNMVFVCMNISSKATNGASTAHVRTCCWHTRTPYFIPCNKIWRKMVTCTASMEHKLKSSASPDLRGYRRTVCVDTPASVRTCEGTPPSRQHPPSIRHSAST